MSTIKWSGYLTIDCGRNGTHVQNWRPKARLSVGKPALGRDEVTVKIEVELPVSLFQRPNLEARVAVPPNQVTPLKIDMTTMDNIEQLIAANTGFDVRLVQVDGKEDR